MGGTGYALVASWQVIDVDVCLCERDFVYRIVNPLKGCYTVSSLCVLERDRRRSSRLSAGYVVRSRI